MAQFEIYLKEIRHQTLFVHGRKDRVIPLSTFMKLIEELEDSLLHVFGKCGHWTQIERTQEFTAIVHSFLTIDPPYTKACARRKRRLSSLRRSWLKLGARSARDRR